MGSNGGARPGAGRKPGAPNKSSQLRLEKARAMGPEPFETLIYAMNFHLKRHQDELKKGPEANEQVLVSELEQARLAAKDAAPYAHPRLTAIAIKDLMDLRREREEATRIQSDEQTIDVTDYKSTDLETLEQLYRRAIEAS